MTFTESPDGNVFKVKYEGDNYTFTRAELVQALKDKIDGLQKELAVCANDTKYGAS